MPKVRSVQPIFGKFARFQIGSRDSRPTCPSACNVGRRSARVALSTCASGPRAQMRFGPACSVLPICVAWIVLCTPQCCAKSLPAATGSSSAQTAHDNAHDVFMQRVASSRPTRPLIPPPASASSSAQAAHDAYVERVDNARMRKPPNTMPASWEEVAPTSARLQHVGRLHFEVVENARQDGAPASSMVQATWPISSDEILRDAVTDQVRFSVKLRTDVL